MKNHFLLITVLLTLIFGIRTEIKAQSQPVLYFCAAFESGGEKNISDRFYLGPVIVVVRCDYVILAKKVTVQFDKYSGADFEYYKALNFNIKAGTKYTYFTDVDMRIDEPGIYRCFMLDENRNTLASAIVEFVK